MKKILIFLLAGLIYGPHITQALALPNILEGNITDYVIQWEENFIRRFKKEGIAQAFGILNFPRLATQRTTAGAQFATPLANKMVNNRALYRFEVNALRVDTSYAVKVGLTGRQILSPHLIAGGYLFYDKFFGLNDLATTSWTTNLGLEAIWPQRGTAITFDSSCNLFNLFGDAEDRFYKASIKCSILRPKVFDLFTGVSITKYPNFSREYLFPLGLKFRIPAKKWNINKRFMFAIAGTYTPQKNIPWKQNIGLCISLQINLLKANIQNSLRDYLRMPIDRLFATPWHPNQHHDDHTPDSTPLTRSGYLSPGDKRTPKIRAPKIRAQDWEEFGLDDVWQKEAHDEGPVTPDKLPSLVDCTPRPIPPTPHTQPPQKARDGKTSEPMVVLNSISSNARKHPKRGRTHWPDGFRANLRFKKPGPPTKTSRGKADSKQNPSRPEITHTDLGAPTNNENLPPIPQRNQNLSPPSYTHTHDALNAKLHLAQEQPRELRPQPSKDTLGSADNFEDALEHQLQDSTPEKIS